MKWTLLFIFWAVSAFAASEEFASMVPLLTPDYGIVTENDRREEARHGDPPKNLPLEPRSTYMVWQCLKLDRVIMKCEACSKDPLAGPRASPTCFTTIQVDSEGSLYDFGPRRVLDRADCLATHVEWKRILSGQRVACFSAYYEEDVIRKSSAYKRISRWSCLSRLKSRLGDWRD